MEIDLSNKCRVCFTENEEMHNLKDELEDGISLLQVFTSTTNFEIDESDELSPFMCMKCAAIVIDFHNLKTIYQENENQIKTLLAKAEECSLNGAEHIEITFDQIPHAVMPLPEQIKIEIYDNAISPEPCSPTDVRFSCVECGDCFLSESDVQNHLYTEHANGKDATIAEAIECKVSENHPYTEHAITESKEVIKCKVCHEEFTEFREWRRHVDRKLHKKNVCEICGARFMKKSYLEDHREVHSNEKKHVCSYCNKAFKRRTVLVKHKKLHTHPRQCVCERCGRAFNARSTLNTHMKLVHHKARNHDCPMCGLKFSLKATLDKHLRRHESKEREFFCTECPLAYKDKSSLDRHVFVKHSGAYKNETCNKCGKKYTTASNLHKHKKNCRGVLEDEVGIVDANGILLQLQCDQVTN